MRPKKRTLQATTLPPAADAFGALVGVLQRALRTHDAHGVLFTAWKGGRPEVIAVDAQGETLDTSTRTAHQQMDWGALERGTHRAAKAFRKPVEEAAHLRPHAKRLTLTVTGPQQAKVAWEWGSLDFTDGLPRDHVATCPPGAHPKGYRRRGDRARGTGYGSLPQPARRHRHRAGHKVARGPAPVVRKLLDARPLVVGLSNKQNPYVSLLGMEIYNPEHLGFLGYPPDTLHAFHTTQGGAQHLDLPAPSSEKAAAFLHAARNNGQLIEM